LTVTTCPLGSPTSICTTGQSVRTSTKIAVDLDSKNGWYVDLPDSGERANTDPQLAFGLLTVTANVPNASACNVGGYSFIYFFDYATGSAASSSTTNVSGVALGNTLATRPVVVKLPNNKVISIVQRSDGTVKPVQNPPGNNYLATRRISWRELVTEQ
jgi:type IV pilus assembly protein PilY1